MGHVLKRALFLVLLLAGILGVSPTVVRADVSLAVKAAPAPGVEVVRTQSELDAAVQKPDLAEIHIVAAEASAEDAALQPGPVLRVSQPRNENTAIKAYGKVHLEITGGQVHLFKGVTVSKAMNGGVMAYSDVVIDEVAGAYVWAREKVTVGRVSKGMVDGRDAVTIGRVEGGYVHADHQATVDTVAGGHVYLWGNSRVATVTGGTLVTHGENVIAAVEGGKVEVNGLSMVEKVTGGLVTAGDFTQVRGVAGGLVVAWGDHNVHIVLGAGEVTFQDGQLYLDGRLTVVGRKIAITPRAPMESGPIVMIEWRENIAIPHTVTIDDSRGERIFGRPDSRRPKPAWDQLEPKEL